MYHVQLYCLYLSGIWKTTKERDESMMRSCPSLMLLALFPIPKETRLGGGQEEGLGWNIEQALPRRQVCSTHRAYVLCAHDPSCEKDWPQPPGVPRS